MPIRGPAAWRLVACTALVWAACSGGERAHDTNDVADSVDGADDVTTDATVADGADATEATRADAIDTDEGDTSDDVPDDTADADGDSDDVSADATDVFPQPAEVVRQEAALELLRGASREPLRLRLRDGLPETLALDVPAPPGAPTESAYQFLEQHRDLFRLEDPRRELAPVEETNADGFRGAAFVRIAHGRPLFGSHLGVHIVGDRIRAVTGRYLAGSLPDGDARVSAAAATETAEAAAGEPALAPPKLVYYAPEMIGAASGPPLLAWQVVPSGPSGGKVLIDADSGAVLLRLSDTATSAPRKDFSIATVNEGCSNVCWREPGQTINPWFDANGRVTRWQWTCTQIIIDGVYWADSCTPSIVPVETDTDGDQAFEALHATYDFYHDHFDQHAWRHRLLPSTAPEPVNVWVHARVKLSDACTNNNAVADHCGITFTTGYAKREVLAHEFTHHLVGLYLLLEYANDTGAINESLADLYGWLVAGGDERFGLGLPGASCCPTPGAACYSRDLKLPGRCGLPDHVMSTFSGDGQGRRPAVSDPDWATNDNGGTHTNSSLLNAAGYRLAEGGTHPLTGIGVTAIGRDKLARLLWQVMTTFETRPLSLAAFGEVAVRHAELLAESGVFTAADVCATRNAYAGAGLIASDRDCDGLLDPEGPDLDGDGVIDGDNCPTTPNATQRDSDGDGRGDACDGDADDDGRRNDQDNCPTVANPGQEDADRDRIGDVCEDPDGDGVFTPRDNCKTVANPDQRDFDRDGKGDVCDDDDDGDGLADSVDLCPGFAWASPSGNDDGDGDTIGFVCDNCTSVPNRDQLDRDNDGLGDPCDTDQDGDGVPDERDNCPEIANADQADCDGDGSGLDCDPGDTRPLSPPPDPSPANGPAFLRDVSLTNPFEPVPLRFPVTLCSGAACLPLVGRTVGVKVELGFIGTVRVLDDEGRLMTESRAKRGHVLRVPVRRDGVDYAPGFTGKRVIVEVIAPGGLARSMARCDVHITAPFEGEDLPPTVNLGPDLVVGPGATVYAVGLASDPEGELVELTWEVVAATPGATVGLQSVGPNGVQFVAPERAGATTTLRAIATDVFGGVGSDELLVTVYGGATESSCADRQDDDLDGAADCADDDCAGAACDDGDGCTAGDACADGACNGGAARECDDDDPCTADGCAGGQCQHTIIAGCCRAASDCDDSDACTVDSCSFGTCAHARLTFCCPGGCDDTNPCTTDSCTRNDGCSHVATTAACDDGNACTRNDRCAGGACAPGPLDCDDANACTTDACVAGQCSHTAIAGCCTTVADCNDGDPCTSDGCANHTCSHAPIAPCCLDAAGCDDGDACTSDTCDDHRCGHAPIAGCCATVADCNDGDACTTDTCVARTCGHAPIAGCCTTAAQCNDHEACTLDRCLFGECSNGPVVGHPACDDSDPCTVDDACSDGECHGAPSSGPGCAAPVVVIHAPDDGTKVPAGAGFVAEADATDADGIARVRFFVDGVAIAEDLTAPWRVELYAPMQAGEHTLAVDAVDGTGVTGGAVTITFESLADPGTELVGCVVDEHGAPIRDAAVAIVDSALAATSGADGTFVFAVAPTSGPLRLAIAAVHLGEPRYGTFGPFTPVPDGTTDAGDLALVGAGIAPVPRLALVSSPVGFIARASSGAHGELAPMALVSAPVGFIARASSGAHGELAPMALVSAPVGFTTLPRIYGVVPGLVGAVGAEIVDLEITLDGIGFEPPLNVDVVSFVGPNQLAVDDLLTEIEDVHTLRFHVHSIEPLVANTYQVIVTTAAGASWSADPVSTLVIGH